MKVLIAPDKFKGTLSAGDAARAMADGVGRAVPGATTVLIPMADGGDGTVAALVDAARGETVTIAATGPLGDPVDAPVGLLGRGRAAFEMASVAGLRLLEGRDLRPLQATTSGVGLVLGEVAARGLATEVIVGVGGSASTDGGAGAAAAAGWRFLDGRGQELDPAPDALTELARIDGSGFDRGVAQLALVGARDVDNPLTGPRGAARVFAPQKGASPSEVEALEAFIERLADRIGADLGIDVRNLPGGGAGGGLGAGLVAFFGARLEVGFATVADAAGLDRAIRDADLVVTGEGRLDEQSLAGKTPVGVARAARRAGIPCVAAVGELDLSGELLAKAGFESAASVIETCGRVRAFEDAAAALAETVAALLSARAAPT